MCIGRVVDADRARARGEGGVGLEERDDAGDWADADASSGRGKKKDSGFQYSFERSGGFRTFRYMFSERSARLACGTYLAADQRSHYTDVGCGTHTCLRMRSSPRTSRWQIQVQA